MTDKTYEYAVIVFLSIIICMFTVAIATEPTPTNNFPYKENNYLTIASTELINWYSYTTENINTYLGLLNTQGIPEFTLRFNAYTEWSSQTPPSSALSKAVTFLNAAAAAGITVNIDSHTWYTTWDSYFRDSASNAAANRVKYLAYITALVNAVKGYSAVKAFMVLNEPQARTASSSENTFINSCINTAQALTGKPVSVRFMAGYSATTGHYSSTIWDNADFLCANTYWDPQHPSTTVYGCTEAKMNALIADANARGKELWITEFGKTYSNEEAQRVYVAGFVSYANSKSIDRIYCWVSQPSATGESYNLFNPVWTPTDAWYELTNGAAVTYTVTASSDANSDISPSGVVVVNEGVTQTFVYSANEGYNIDSLLVDAAPSAITGSYTFSNIVADHTIAVTAVAATPEQGEGVPPAAYFYVLALTKR